MQTHKIEPNTSPGTQAATPTRLATMQEAMEYLSSKGIPCKSRDTFYRILRDFNVPFVNTNPNGKNAIRRFDWAELERVVTSKGLEP